MLTQYDIDELQMQIQNDEKPELFVVVNFNDTREGIIDEAHYKSVPRYKIVKININEIVNAYYEYLEFKKFPGNYHVETEEEYYDSITKYIHYYTVPNTLVAYNKKDFNAKMPSIIYGYRRQTYENEELISDYSDPSPIKPVYTNTREYGGLKGVDLEQAIEDRKLDWKYMELESPIESDGILFNYITSDWYVLKAENFPTVEHILINTNHKTSFFRTLEEAYNFRIQCES